MRYGVSGKLRKGIALAVSIALVICTAPAVPALADGTTGNASAVKQVNFGVADEGLAAGTDKEKITLSIAPGFSESFTMANTEVKNEEPPSATGWTLAEEGSEQDMGANVKGDKIILVEGYGERADYLSYSVKAEHEKASDVLTGASDVYSLISTKDNEILYYGKIDTDTKTDSSYSCFRIPKGLEKGNYNLYIFAENNNTGNPKKIYTSKLGNPIEIEVVPSARFGVTGLGKPEAGKTPDKKALLKIEKGNNTTIEKDVDVAWKDIYGTEVTDKFDYNRVYTAYINLEEYITGYIFGENIAKINNENAEFRTMWETASYEISSIYQTEQLDEIKISGYAGDDNTVTLKAYTGVTPPVTTNPEYTYEWWNDSETSGPAGTGQSHVITQDDFNNGKIKLNTASQNNAASKELNITDGFIETDMIEGVSKTDESVKGKSDGKIEGLAAGMAYSLDGINYNPCASGTVEGLAAGTTCRIKIEKDNLIPSGLKGIYADYTIGEGNGMLSVSFDSKGGSAVNTIDGIAYNGTIAAPPEPVKEGYIFDGWYTDEAGNTKWNFGQDRVVQNITLIAIWRQNQTAKPDNTQKPPVATATAPGNTNTQKPPVTTAPGSTGTAVPASTATPQAGTNPVLPYIPQPPEQAATVPVQTQAPASTQEPAVQTQEPVQPQDPVQTQAPASQPASSQAPAASQTPEPSQMPAAPETNLPQDSIDETGNPMPKGEKAVAGGTEYESSGNGNVTLSGTIGAGNGNIVIPGTVDIGGITYKVTEIGKEAFANSGIKNVELGSNIIKIAKGAFKNCKKLKKVHFPSGLGIVGQGAFKNCVKLSEVNLPASVHTIKKNAFKNNKSLKKFVLGKKEKSSKNGLKKFALRYGTNVAKVTIGASALENCDDLRSVVINSQVTKIGNSTFRYCSQLRKMLVKSLKLQKVGSQALKGVNNCKIKVPPVKLKPYTTLFKNKGQGKKVVVAKS